MSSKLKSNKRKKIRLSICIYLISLICISLGIGSLVSLNCKKETFVLAKNDSEFLTFSELKNGQKELSQKKLKPVFYSSFEDAVLNSKSFSTSFKGKLVHYGPDCAQCGGHLGCNGQDARNGNIYYNDKEYGKIRIVATSSSIPCGSILRINVNAYNNMYVIVLDRGVGSGMVDLLKVSQKSKSPVRTLNNVIFDIVRYGY